jgi:hypothetical protein
MTNKMEWYAHQVVKKLHTGFPYPVYQGTEAESKLPVFELKVPAFRSDME